MMITSLLFVDIIVPLLYVNRCPIRRKMYTCITWYWVHKQFPHKGEGEWEIFGGMSGVVHSPCMSEPVLLNPVYLHDNLSITLPYWPTGSTPYRLMPHMYLSVTQSSTAERYTHDQFIHHLYRSVTHPSTAERYTHDPIAEGGEPYLQCHNCSHNCNINFTRSYTDPTPATWP